MKKGFFLICVITTQLVYSQIFTRPDSLRGTLFPERSCYDVFYYDLEIGVQPDEKKISGTTIIHCIATTTFKTIQIDLFSNMNIEYVYEIIPDTLYVNQERLDSLKFYREGNAVFIQFNRQINKDENVQFAVSYTGHPKIAKNPPWDGGFSWEKDKNGNDWIGVSCQGLGASSWWPCKDHQSDEPDSMRILCSIPYTKKNIQVVSNGNLRKTYFTTQFESEQQQTYYEWFVSYPINNYNVTINIGDYTHFSDIYIGEEDTLNLDYYVLSYNEEKAINHFKQVEPMLRCFESFLGPYPFPKDGFALIETPYLGMEHQSAIAYGNDYLPGYLGNKKFISGLGFDYIILHETGHEWWGNSITTNDIADMWIQEGFCTYSEALYVECIYGYDTMIDYVLNQKNMIRNDGPILGVYGVNKEGSGDMYQKASLILHTLRTLLENDTLWISILQGLQIEFKHKTIDGDDVIKYINARSGYDFTNFFEQYLTQSKLPILEYYIEKKKRKWILYFRWNAIEKFDMPILAKTDQVGYSWIYPNNNWQDIQLNGINPVDFQVAEHLFLLELEKLK